MGRGFRQLPLVLAALGLVHCDTSSGVPDEEPGPDSALLLPRGAACQPAIPLGDFAPEHVSGMVEVDDVVFFSVGTWLWKSDARTGHAERVRQIPPDEPDGGIRGLTEVGGLLVFASGTWMWRSDGTPEETYALIISRSTNGPPVPLGLHDGELLFRMDAPMHGVELWATDGTRKGTRFVADLNPGLPSSYVGPATTTDRGDFVFGARLGSDEQGIAVMKLTRSDKLVTLFRASDCDLSLLQLRSVGDKVFFLLGREGRGDSDLYVSDGTPNGTTLLKHLDGTTPARAFTAFDDRLFFVAEPEASGTDAGSAELWVSDGTRAGTHVLVDLRHGVKEGSVPTDLTVFEGRLYFAADDGVHGRELWSTDGTEEGTQLVEDIWPGPHGSNPYGLRMVNQKLYFVADDGVHGAEPWKVYEGRARLLADIVAGAGGSTPQVLGSDPDTDETFFRTREYVYFATGDTGSSLWAVKTESVCPGR
ncbi:hypothetical protein LZ198_15120 [Myxococcus sp. K15C18031901]|uniref:ELWxxDGT repeat protein n=1 Tax=Myxococcus dinghuensis TaxID=2906761 RepID=UPI0020A7BE44|nr:ELWxxDGT repeat protein [Myxococcus dinghuensis]MCP3100202.1 hypothetical protein [Myxococcus dinghuensis]